MENMEDEEVFEPFNLVEERESGHFQEDGFYVRKQHVLDEDAWLNSEEGIDSLLWAVQAFARS